MALSDQFFNAKYYLEQNADVAAAWGGTAWEHYLTWGASEGRAPNAWFDAQYYRANNADLAGMNALELFEHYTNHGYAEARVPDSAYAKFDAEAYLADYADLETGGITAKTALNHYLTYGIDEGRVGKNTDGTKVQDDQGTTTGTLTSGSDVASANFIDGSSVFEAGTRVQTLGNADQLTGTGEDARLYLEVVNTAATVVTPQSMAGIVQVDIDGGYQGNNFTLNTRNADSIKTLNVSNTGGNVTLNNLATALTSIEVTNNAANAITATSLADALSGTEDSVTITVDNYTGAGAMSVGPATGTNGYETVNVVSNGQTANVIGGLTTTGATTLNVTGAQNLTTGQLSNTVTTIGAADFTGNLNATMGNGNMSVTGGTGNDTFDFAATQFTTADTVAGGDGTDTIRGTFADMIAMTTENSNITSIERLVIDTPETANTLRADLIGDSVNSVVFADAGNAAHTVRFESGANAVSYSDVAGLFGAAETFGAPTFEANGTSTTDSLTLTLEGDDATAAGTQTANITLGNLSLSTATRGIEQLAIVSNNATATHTIGTVTLPNTVGVTDSVTITGNSAITLGAVAADSLDASGLTNNATVNMGAASTRAIAITGGSGNDTLAGSAAGDSITGGAGNDQIDGNAGADLMAGGAGVDTFIFNAGDSVASSANALTAAGVAVNDTITFGGGVDIISDFAAGTGGDVLDTTNAGLPTSGIGLAVAGGFAAGDAYYLSGTFNSGTGLFTVAAAGSGPDTAFIEGSAAALNASTEIIILMGVDSDDLVAANIV
jgi:hypothetical protein